jgi:hypothetical protein
VKKEDRMPNIYSVYWLVEAFYELATTRAYTMGGAASIPITAIWAWAERHSAPPWFTDAILAIDSKWIGLNSGK